MDESSESLELQKITQRLDYIRKNNLYSDCQFKIGERIFYAHKLILAISSSVFDEMLYGNGSLNESKKEPIHIADIEPEAFESLLDYIYSNRLTINSLEGAVNLSDAAKKYLIISLPEKCWKYVKTNFDSEGFIQQKLKIIFNNIGESMWNQCKFQIRLKTFAERLHHIRNGDLFSDCQFKVGEKIFDAHKLILAITSPIFEAMLYGNSAGSTKEPILVTDIEPEAFECLLDYIYAQRPQFNSVENAKHLICASKKYLLPSLEKKCSNYIQNRLNCSPKFDSVENAINLMCTANQYLIPSLQKKCSNYIQNRLNCRNVFQAYEFAVLHKDSSLKSKSLNYIQSHTSGALKYCDYANISIDTLLTVLKLDDMVIRSELELFTALEKFAESNGFTEYTKKDGGKPSAESSSNTIDNVKQSKLREAIKCIRFLSMTPDEFTSGPSTSKLLFPHESSNILAKLKSPTPYKLPYPKGFSEKTERRFTKVHAIRDAMEEIFKS